MHFAKDQVACLWLRFVMRCCGFFNVALMCVDMAPPRPPLPHEGAAPMRPPPPETDDEDETVFRNAQGSSQPIMVGLITIIMGAIS